MLEAINTWADYRTKLREFDAVLEHGKAASAALVGLTLTEPHTGYGERIFVKLLAHSTTLRRLAPEPGEQPTQALWDMPSMCAVARCVVEAHDAFDYIAGHAVTDAERGFRIRLWELHDATRRLKMLDGIGSTDPAVDDIRNDARRLQAALEKHPFLAILPSELRMELQRRFARNDPPAFHLSQRQRCAMSQVNADWHNAITLQLSQHVHTLPFSVHQLFNFQAGSPDALRQMALPLVFALPFLARAIHAIDALLPGRVPKPPSRTARTMAVWRELAAQGVKTVG